jgi:hypothetical protein
MYPNLHTPLSQLVGLCMCWMDTTQNESDLMKKSSNGQSVLVSKRNWKCEMLVLPCVLYPCYEVVQDYAPHVVHPHARNRETTTDFSLEKENRPEDWCK